MSKKILICDDAVTIRKLLSVVIRDAGFDVVEAENGKIALDLAQREAVDLIIVDVNMPVMGGIEFIGEVRKIPRYQKTPIFVLTTETGKAAADKGRSTGATAWILKPFKPDVLLGGIAKFLGPIQRNS